MGIPTRVATNWINYLDKGGRFKEAKDVRKIYGMTTELFDRLESSVLIPDEVKSNQEITKPKNRINSPSYQRINAFNYEKNLTTIDSVELNLADSTALEHLPGIGPVLAPRIIRYRNLLGGFYSVSQLREVYGLREEHYLAASPYLYIEGEPFRRFNINFASVEELGRHPYIGFRTARKIINLKDKRGKYSSVKDLSEVMTTDSIERLSPYLKFNQ
jgi:competence protein ComEA